MTTKNRLGERDAASQAWSSVEERIRQIQSLLPGIDGGGSVKAPFKIGGYTFEAGGQIDIRRLAEISASAPIVYQPEHQNLDLGDGGYTTGIFSVDYNRMVDFTCVTVLGSSPTVGTGPTWTVPLLPDSEYTHAIGNSVGYDASGSLQDFRTILLTGMQVEPRFSTTTPSLGQVTATTPITWVVTDRFYIRGRYRASESAT
jgi:hypothetical protein